jgi:hypothetical protein
MVAIQTVTTGKIPVNIISPSILQNILKNISLNLHEGYELIMGSNTCDTERYYEFVHAAMVTNPQGFMLILSIPIKNVYRQFELFRLYNFPTEVINGTFVKFNVETHYLAIYTLQRTYLLLSEYELSQCPGRELKICAAKHTVYSAEVKTCALSLYLQLENLREICERTVSTKPPQPTLRRQGSVVVYHPVKPRQTHIRCRHEGKWETTSIQLHGSGTLRNTASCHVTTEGVQLCPVLSGETTFTGYTPNLYAPHLPAVATSSEVRKLKDIAYIKQIENLASTVQAHHVETNLDILIHFHSTRIPHPNPHDWYTPIIISFGTVTLLHIMFHFPYSYIRKMLRRFKIKETPEAIPDSSVPDTQ